MYGCIQSKKDLRNYKIKSNGSKLPDEFLFDGKIRIKSQGNVGSCVAHAVSTILETYDNCEHELSTNFIYGFEQRITRGMSISDACKIVQQYGDMLLEDCKGNDEIPKCFDICKRAISNESNMRMALYFRINSYFDCDTIEDIKYAIKNYGLVVANIRWYKKYKINSKNVINMDKSSERICHAVVIIGWNEYGFICLNSWGKTFGYYGTFVLPYNEEILEAKCLVDHKPNPSEHIVVPKTNHVLDKGYKILNLLINFF